MTTHEDLRSVRRAFAALDFLVAAAPTAVRVTAVAGHLDVTPATASRVLATLVDLGHASRTPDRRYTLGPRSICRATGWVGRLRASALGPMNRVGDATGEAVIVSQLLGHREYPFVWRWPRSGPLTTDLDARIPPLWATASGRALLAALPPAQRTRLLPPEPYPRLTPQTTTRWTDLRQLIRVGIRDGLHFETGEVGADAWCCSVSLEPGESGEVLAMTVVCLGEPTPRRRQRIHRALRHEARTVSAALLP